MCDWSLDLCSSYLPAIAIIGRLDHRRRLLPGVGRVEIHQRLAVDLAPQQGEVLAHARPVDSRVGVAVCRCSARKAHRGSSSAASAASIRAPSAVRRASDAIPPSGARTKARSEESRVGGGWVGTGSSRWPQYHYKNTNETK